MKLGFLLPLFLIVFFSGCSSGDNKTEPLIQEFEVSSSKSVCLGMVQTSCIQAKVDGSDSYTNIFESVTGFDFEWGVISLIHVKVIDVENPPADGSSIAYELYSIDSQTLDPIGTEYIYSNLELFSHTISLNEAQYQFLGEDITCAAVDCDALIQLTDMGAIVNLTFTLNGQDEIELTNWN